jgi:excisionase family DNA binding protein
MQTVAAASRQMLTARQVQQLLGIDRSTVYRMAGDGRLPSVRVGKQLRFPADRLGDMTEPAVDPRRAAGAVAVAAPLLGVTMVVADMEGRPLTPIANPAPWFLAHQDDDELRACLAEWRAMADDPDLAPRFVAGPQDFECARAFIRDGARLVGMVLAGGVAPPGAAARPDLHHLDADARAAVLRALPVVAAALAPAPGPKESS